MSDAELRALERAWRERGDPQDGAAWLRARVQVGDLSEERLNLAAYLDHEAACLATGFAGPGPRLRVFDFARGLASFEVEVQVRAGLAAVASRSVSERALPTHVQACLSAVREWLEDPTPERAEQAFWAGQRVGDYCGHAYEAYRQLGWIPGGIDGAARLLGWPRDDERYSPLVSCLVELDQRSPGRTVEAVREAPIPGQTAAAVREALIPWALASST